VATSGSLTTTVWEELIFLEKNSVANQPPMPEKHCSKSAPNWPMPEKQCRKSEPKARNEANQPPNLDSMPEKQL
jgi:hypothetical protein